ncbi:MAG TPA: hypothetical protein VFA98_06550 [Thermoanaerobaculia bacterium]|jgi:hypothetical protein|nr:hypothetical protein [Thermoanaerobaculia bacterium]
MADGSRGGWDGSPFSKKHLLEIAVSSGAIYTARIDGAEVPYDGAPFHAEELEREGLFARVPNAPVLEGVDDYVVWVPTAMGTHAAKGKAS